MDELQKEPTVPSLKSGFIGNIKNITESGVQTETTVNNSRIAKNTLLLYFRMFFTMTVNLYVSRVVLKVLGVEDYGIYNVVGGVVAMFSVISGSLSAAIGRFLTFELGTGNDKKLRRIFSTAITVQYLMAVTIIILAEVIGVWFLNAKMNIPADRMGAANGVLQCSIFTFAINLISIPYNASIVAHERMSVFAYVSILEVILKLIAVFMLYVITIDKLKLWALLLLGIAIVIFFTYRAYCKRKFKECNSQFIIYKPLLKQMTSFAGWNFIGASSSVLRDHGVNVILNLFCGPAINAARGISMQVSSAINGFTTNFMTALNPQITKSYVAQNQKYLMELIQRGGRFSYYLLLFFSLPVFIEISTILDIWLDIVPPHTIMFVRLILIQILIESISGPLITAMLATGQIRNYQIVVGGLQLLNFPISYLMLKFGFFPEITVIIAIILSLCILFVRLIFLRDMIKLKVRYFIRHVLGNISIVTLLSAILPCCLYLNMPEGWVRFFLICCTAPLSIAIIIYFIGCDLEERMFMKNKFMQLLKKIRLSKKQNA